MNLEQSLLTLFDLSRDAMYVTDHDGVFTHVNKSFLELYNYTEDDVIGQPITMIKSNLYDNAFFSKIWEELISKGIWSGELRNTSYAGEIIHIWTQMIKTDTAIVGIQIDLRDKEWVEQQFERSSRLESISTLAGGIAYEFNDILAGLQGHLQMIQRAIPPENEQENERISRIDNLIQRADGLVQNMLAFSRQKQTSTRELSLPAIVEELFKLARPFVPKQIELILEVNRRGLITLGNEIQLKQILFELISNALNAFDRMDEATLPNNPVITVTLDQQDANTAMITIRDNGYGMKAHELKHCMDPFFTTKLTGTGTGLGLSTALSYIKQLGGSLEISSTFMKGTVVRILLPLVHESSRIEPLGQTVLLVDDDEAIRVSLHEILIGYGYDVIEAANGLDALEHWHRHADKIDAIVMDVIMPHMDGLEVASKIRETDSRIPICILSSYSHRTIPDELMVHTLWKPVDLSLIVQFLQQQLPAGKQSSG